MTFIPILSKKRWEIGIDRRSNHNILTDLVLVDRQDRRILMGKEDLQGRPDLLVRWIDRSSHHHIRTATDSARRMEIASDLRILKDRLEVIDFNVSNYPWIAILFQLIR